MAAENIETVNVEANVEQTNADDAETEVEAETIQLTANETLILDIADRVRRVAVVSVGSRGLKTALASAINI